MSAQPLERREGGRPALTPWALAATIYLLAVLHRTSLGVAGLLAERRFAITPAQLSVFIFLQLGVYAAMQVPTGVLVDRYGPRRLLATAALTMGAAQLLFALVASYPVALLARALLGCGDALTFISVLRFTATHFDARRYPMLVALTALFGTAGNVLATLPLALLLRHLSWVVVFGGAAALSLLAGLLVWLMLPDSTRPAQPIRAVADVQAGVRSVWDRVWLAWALPGTRLGFWVHFACMSMATAFGVLWGGTYLVKAVGLSTAGAGGVLMAGVLTAAVAGPAYGWTIGRRPELRVPLALGVCVATMAGWLAVVIVGGAVPARGAVIALFAVMAIGPPLSVAAFALARDYNNARSLGTASGVVNVGGFVAAVVIALGIGWALDLQGATSPGTLRWAVLVGVVVQGAGTWRVVVWYRRVRAFALAQQALGEPVPVPVVRRAWDLPA